MTDRSDGEVEKRLKLFAWGFTAAAAAMAVVFLGIAVLINILGK